MSLVLFNSFLKKENLNVWKLKLSIYSCSYIEETLTCLRKNSLGFFTWYCIIFFGCSVDIWRGDDRAGIGRQVLWSTHTSDSTQHLWLHRRSPDWHARSRAVLPMRQQHRTYSAAALSNISVGVMVRLGLGLGFYRLYLETRLELYLNFCGWLIWVGT